MFGHICATARGLPLFHAYMIEQIASIFKALPCQCFMRHVENCCVPVYGCDIKRATTLFVGPSAFYVQVRVQKQVRNDCTAVLRATGGKNKSKHDMQGPNNRATNSEKFVNTVRSGTKVLTSTVTLRHDLVLLALSSSSAAVYRTLHLSSRNYGTSNFVNQYKYNTAQKK